MQQIREKRKVNESADMNLLGPYPDREKGPFRHRPNNKLEPMESNFRNNFNKTQELCAENATQAYRNAVTTPATPLKGRKRNDPHLTSTEHKLYDKELKANHGPTGRTTS